MFTEEEHIVTHSQIRPRVLAGASIEPDAKIQRCTACGAEICFGVTAKGRRCPFDVHRGADGSIERSAVTHFSTCPEVRQFTKRT